MTSAALEALNLMQSRDLASRRRLLDASLLQALGTTTTAQLWASAVELVEDSDATKTCQSPVLARAWSVSAVRSRRRSSPLRLASECTK